VRTPEHGIGQAKAGIKQAQIVNTGAREPEHLNGKAGKEAETNCGNK